MNNLLNDHSEVVSFEKEMEKISPFELKDRLIQLAGESIRKMTRTMLNAGRGNPNWVATVPREAFFAMGRFSLDECRLDWEYTEGLAGIPHKEGIAARFEAFLNTHRKEHGVEFLEKCYRYMLQEHRPNADELVHEWAESVIGNQYPVPDRILYFTEVAMRDYFAQELCD
ncbi:MAG: aspartate 4-decarboxylase, partial [Clostridia bacterium]|nr:aspartate 4-decarboxylase [Clostridia bacterium]